MKHKKHDKEAIELLVEKFNHQTLAKPDWTHEAHLITAIWYISKYDYFDAVCRLKSGIILLNNAHHKENTSQSGYHETITIFWSAIISTYIKLARVSLLEDLVNDFLDSPLAEYNLLFEFYTRKKLMTPDLRTIYAEGDLKPFDEPTIRLILGVS